MSKLLDLTTQPSQTPSRQFHLQLLVTTFAATLLGVLPLVRSYQLKKSKALESMAMSEKRVTYLILAGITGLHVGEALKSVVFGLQYYNTNNMMGMLPYIFVMLFAIIANELGRVLCSTAIILRTADFLARAQDPPSTRLMRVRWLHLLAGFRVAAPLFISIMTPLSLYGTFAAMLIGADVIICAVASFCFVYRVQERSNKELLPAISGFVLYSNAIVSGTLAIAGLIVAAAMGAAANGNFGTSKTSMIFFESLPSIYNMIEGVLLCYVFWDVKEILAENSPTGAQARRNMSMTGVGRNVFTF